MIAVTLIYQPVLPPFFLLLRGDCLFLAKSSLDLPRSSVAVPSSILSLAFSFLRFSIESCSSSFAPLGLWECAGVPFFFMDFSPARSLRPRLPIARRPRDLWLVERQFGGCV